MSENSSITAEALSAAIGITERNIRINIKKLKDAGLIDRVGEDKKRSLGCKKAGVIRDFDATGVKIDRRKQSSE